MDLGFFLTSQAIRRQLAAMPCELYLIRLIHSRTRKPFPGERLWTAPQLCHPTAVRFLRARNREQCDIYLHPYTPKQNAGYILVDLDEVAADTMEMMRSNGHEPCVVLQTSPGRQQVWIRVSSTPLPPAEATAVGKHLAHLYGGDPRSTDWCHLGRLAGFTNQKPARRLPNGYAPWVKLLHAHQGEATQSLSLRQAAAASLLTPSPPALPRTRIAPYAVARKRQPLCLPPKPRPCHPQPPSPSTLGGCTACAFWNGSHSPIGVSPICGSPRNCSHVASRSTWSAPSSKAAAQDSHAATPIPRIIWGAP